MIAATSTRTGGRGRLLRRRAGRASTVLGLTVVFGSAMTGQAFSDPGNGNGQPPGGAPAKITICHATGSETNPYEEITIGVNGLHGHDGHEGDIIPAPQGGCPGPAVERERERVTICHATGSETNPYELITIDVNGLHGHEGHEGDIIPAPEGGCPVPATTTTTTVPATTTTTTVPATTTTTTVPATTTTTVPATTTTTTVAETTTTTAPVTTTTVAETTTTTVAPTTITTVAGTSTGGGTTPPPAVLGVTFEAAAGAGPGSGPPAPATTVLGAHFERSGGTLARTGSGLTGLATAGLGLLVLGVLLKLSARPVPATVRVTTDRH